MVQARLVARLGFNHVQHSWKLTLVTARGSNSDFLWIHVSQLKQGQHGVSRQVRPLPNDEQQLPELIMLSRREKWVPVDTARNFHECPPACKLP